MSRWQHKLAYTLAIKDGREMVTLYDASYFILCLTDAVQRRQAWQRATELLIEAADYNGSIEAATEQLRLALFLDGPLDLQTTAAPDKG
jgi:hypothetical protein